MSTVLTGNFKTAFFPTQLNKNSVGLHCFFLTHFNGYVYGKSSTAKVRAFSTGVVETNPTEPSAVEIKEECNGSNIVLACPVCYEPLNRIGSSALYVGSTTGSSLECKTCGKTYSGTETQLDLDTHSGSMQYEESMRLVTKMFSTPLVSFLYEKGWRQSFNRLAGFPDPEKEFDMIKKYIKPVLGGKIIDASCARGLFSRILPRVGYFRRKVTLVSANSTRLPFKSSSVDAVHAGAALHCWPSPSIAIAEISRVLRPVGIFVATTSILDGPLQSVPFLRTYSADCDGNIRLPFLEMGSSLTTFYRSSALEDLCWTFGLVGFTCIRNGPFVMISAKKPS